MKYYEREQRELPQLYNRPLDVVQSTKVFNKLKRHYKLERLQLIFKKGMHKGNGRFFGGRYVSYIQLGRSSSLGVLVHEIAHAIEHSKFRDTKHQKRLWGIQKRVAHYVLGKNHWGLPVTSCVGAVNLNDVEGIMDALLK